VTCSVTMSTARAFIALGSNLGDSPRVLAQAVKRIALALDGRAIGCSKLYASAPELVHDQPTFLNAAIELQVPASLALAPQEILRRLKQLEAAHEKSTVRYGPRELDLDLIALSDGSKHNIQDEVLPLQVPHPRAHERDFVLRPLNDLPTGSQVRLGPQGEAASTLLARLPQQTAFDARNTIWAPKRYTANASAERTQDATMVMGILNVTPDSFSDGGRFTQVDRAVKHALDLCEQGADVIDVGGESTRPNAELITVEEELSRVIPVIDELSKLREFSASISIDTRKPEVARAAIHAGANVINDEAGEADDTQAMLAVAGDLGVPIMTMHARGNAKTMESMTNTGNDFDVTEYVFDWLAHRATVALTEHGVPTWHLMMDPGLGFAKTAKQNVELLARLERFTNSPYPVLVGASRKRFVREHCSYNIDTTTCATTVASALHGAAMVRVHDVQAAVDVLRLADAIRSLRR